MRAAGRGSPHRFGVCRLRDTSNRQLLFTSTPLIPFSLSHSRPTHFFCVTWNKKLRAAYYEFMSVLIHFNITPDASFSRDKSFFHQFLRSPALRRFFFALRASHDSIDELKKITRLLSVFNQSWELKLLRFNGFFSTVGLDRNSGSLVFIPRDSLSPTATRAANRL